MQFIDEAQIYIKAGNGGHGAVSFRREKYIEHGGPDGGDGGGGSSVIFKSNSHLNTLIQFRFKRHFKADNGEQGKGYNKTGKSMAPLILEVPVGTQIYSEDGHLLIYDFVNDQEEFEIIKGGKGGLGNSHFKSSTNQSPRKRTDGEVGEEMEVVLKMKLLSDAGLIGLPNVGKSTFLSVSTSAKPKIADYHFTTLKPGLGVVYISEEEFVLADIPGLIAGAHEGHGLGDRFLKHIERCGVLIHVIDAGNEDAIADYKTIREELESYSPLLKDKYEILCINKIDSVTEEEVAKKAKALSDLTGKKVHLISGYTREGVETVLKKTLEAVKAWQNNDEDFFVE
jgi:GTPase